MGVFYNKQISIKKWNEYIDNNYNSNNQWDYAMIGEIDNLNNEGEYSERLIKDLKKLGFKYFTLDSNGELNLYHSVEEAMLRQTTLYSEIEHNILEM